MRKAPLLAMALSKLLVEVFFAAKDAFKRLEADVPVPKAEALSKLLVEFLWKELRAAFNKLLLEFLWNDPRAAFKRLLAEFF